MLDQLKKQHAQFCMQRDQAYANYQQLVGAIHAYELMIKQNENQGEIDNGQVNNTSEEQVA